MMFDLSEYPKLLWEPTEDQAKALEVLPTKRGYINADVTGKGKTYAALASFAVLERDNPNLHLLVLSTKSAVASWRSDISNGTLFDFLEFTTSTEHLNDLADVPFTISVMTYTSIKKYPAYLHRMFESRDVVVVADEFHRAANPESFIGKVTRYLREHASHFWGLTATPLGNHIESLYNLVEVIRPGYLGHSFSTFAKKYCFTRLEKIPGRSRKKRLVVLGLKKSSSLAGKLSAVMLRRDIDVPVEFHRSTVRMTESEEQTYLVAAHGEMGQLETETLKQFSARLPDLQLVVNNAADLGKNFNEDLDQLHSKEARFLEMAQGDLANEDSRPLVVFTSSLWTQDRLLALSERYLDYGRLLHINGGSSEDERAEISKTFGGEDILIMSPAGGESLNLQASGHLIFFDLPYDLRQFVQAAGRVVRMNTEHPKVHIYIMEALETIDSYKSLMVFANSQLFQDVMRGTKALPPVKGKVSKDLLARMRKRLLWRWGRVRTR